MAKGQMRSNREIRKPKMKKKEAPVVTPFGKSTPIMTRQPRKKG